MIESKEFMQSDDLKVLLDTFFSHHKKWNVLDEKKKEKFSKNYRYLFRKFIQELRNNKEKTIIELCVKFVTERKNQFF